MSARRGSGGYGWPNSGRPTLVPPVRVFRGAGEVEASRALDSADHLSRLRRACRRLVALVIAEAAAIAGLLIFLVRNISS